MQARCQRGMEGRRKNYVRKCVVRRGRDTTTVRRAFLYPEVIQNPQRTFDAPRYHGPSRQTGARGALP